MQAAPRVSHPASGGPERGRGLTKPRPWVGPEAVTCPACWLLGVACKCHLALCRHLLALDSIRQGSRKISPLPYPQRLHVSDHVFPCSARGDSQWPPGKAPPWRRGAGCSCCFPWAPLGSPPPGLAWSLLFIDFLSSTRPYFVLQGDLEIKVLGERPFFTS